MVYHYKCYDVIKKYPECRKIYEHMPKYGTEKIVSALRNGLNDPPKNEVLKEINDSHIPLFKLSWKVIPENPFNDSLAKYLFTNN